MKKTIKLLLTTIIFFIIVSIKNNAFAEIKQADVQYGDITDSGVETTITFSEDMTGNTKLTDAGWTINGTVATKTLEMGTYYYYCYMTTSDGSAGEEAVVAVPNKAKVGDTLKLAGINSTISNVKIADLGTVSGTDIKLEKAGETIYTADITETYITTSGETITRTVTPAWPLIVEEASVTPTTPTYKDVEVTYGEPTEAGVLVTLKFSEDVSDEAKANLSDWTFSGNTATRTMKQGAIATVTVQHSDNVIEKAKVAVPITLNIGEGISLSKIATNLKVEDTSIVSLEDGALMAKASGTTTVTGTSIKNNEEYTWTVKVNSSDNKTPTPENPTEDDDKNEDGNGNGTSSGTDNGNNQSGNEEKGNSEQGDSNGANENQSNNNGSEKKSGTDTTTSNKILAKTGSASVIPVFAVLIVLVLISYKNYRKHKNN